jgi:hypothetical protein
MPYVFKCRFITNTISVTDITGDAPQLGIRGMQVDPHRGDLYLGSCAGTFRLRNP